MVNFRRYYIKGGCYFFTVTLRDRNSTVLVDHIDVLRQSIHQVKKENSFQIQAIVILPNHLHTIWTLPKDDNNYSQRLRKFKSYFTHKLNSKNILIPKDKRGEHLLWQRRFWEHHIRNEKDFENHVNYIHFNPVKHGVVKQVCDWPYSSFHRFVEKGLLNRDWGGVQTTFEPHRRVRSWISASPQSRLRLLANCITGMF